MSLERNIAITIWALSIIMVYALMMTMRSGARLGSGYLRNPALVALHRRWRWTVVATVCAIILVVDPAFRVLHLPLTRFFWRVHLPFIIAFIVALGGTWRLNGLRSQWHSVLGKATLIFGALTALSGDWLAYTLLWR